jgi:integrase
VSLCRSRMRASELVPWAVGIRGLVPHVLRRTAASLAIRAGANVRVVQRRLGQATAAMTLDRYGHLLNDDPTAVADALSNAIARTAVSLRYSQRTGSAAEDQNVA